METIEFKIYVTFRVFAEGDIDQDPDDFLKALCAEIEHRVYHYPGGEVLEMEIK